MIDDTMDDAAGPPGEDPDYLRSLATALLEALPHVSAAVFNRDLRIVWAQASAAHGWTTSELVGQAAVDVLAEEAAPGVLHLLRRALAGEAAIFEHHTARTGRLQRASVQPLRDATGEIVAVLGVLEDVDDLRKWETELEQATVALGREFDARRMTEERFRQLFDDSPIGMVLLDRDGLMVEVNPAFAAVWGVPPEACIGSPMDLHDDTRDPDRYLAAHRAILNRDVAARPMERRIIAADGRAFHCRITAFALSGAVPGEEGVLAMVEDISERVLAEARLKELASVDTLTGLANRNAFRTAATAALQPDGQTSIAVLYCDLDHFKNINDSLGHTFGDEVLRVVARRLASRVGGLGLVSRHGGDEFVILLPGIPDDPEAARATAVTVAERVTASVAAPMVVASRIVHTSASVGIAIAQPGGATAEDLLRDADAAMFRAKRERRGGWDVFDAELRDITLKRLEVEAGLHRALERGELRVHYQPIVDIETGAAVGAEALVRWAHPTRGLLLPAEFLSVAEDTGMIDRIGDWVLDESCKTLRRFQAAGTPLKFVSVNVSARQLGRGTFPAGVVKALARHDLEPHEIKLEVTENVLLEEGAPTVELEELLAAGIPIGLDDFGTGYASLTYLDRFNVSFVKLDKSFVARLNDSPIAAAVVNLARALDVDVVAEGVETRDQADRLAQLGCKSAQGWLYGRAVPADRLANRTGLDHQEDPDADHPQDPTGDPSEA